jgi:ribosomal protein S1
MSPNDPKKDPGPRPEELAESGEFARLLAESERSLKEGELIRGRVVQVTNDEVLVDIGFKSEGMIPRHEFTGLSADKLPHPGDEIEAVLEKTRARAATSSSRTSAPAGTRRGTPSRSPSRRGPPSGAASSSG